MLSFSRTDILYIFDKVKCVSGGKSVFHFWGRQNLPERGLPPGF